MSHIFKASELRTGNQLSYLTAEGDSLNTAIDWQDLKWLDEDPEGFNAVHTPIVLTEPIMQKVRCQYHKDNSAIEFQVCPPRERQVENNYYSREVLDNRILHLSPSYEHERVGEKEYVKSNIPKFWLIWLCSHGTGSAWFLNIRDCRINALRYFHDLQNLYYSISGLELFLKEETGIEATKHP